MIGASSESFYSMVVYTASIDVNCKVVLIAGDEMNAIGGG